MDNCRAQLYMFSVSHIHYDKSQHVEDGPGRVQARHQPPPPLGTLADNSCMCDVLRRSVNSAGGSGVLNLERCALEALPVAAGKLKTVRFASLQHNGLKALSPEVVGLPGLLVLNATHNQVGSCAFSVLPMLLACDWRGHASA